MEPSRTVVSPKCEFTLQREKAKSIFSSINQYRASKKIPALTWDDTIYSYCVLHNIDMHSSTMKTSNFSMGYGYNENVAHFPGSPKRVLDIWKSRSNEKENMLFEGVKYSAIAIYADDNECYATQIFMEHRPKKNDKVVSMKTEQLSDTYGSKSTMASKSKGSITAKSVASTKLRKKKVSSSPKKGESGKPSLIKSVAKKLGLTSNQPTPKKAVDRPSSRTERITGASKPGRQVSNSASVPRKVDRGSRPKTPAKRPSVPGNGRANRPNEDIGSDSSHDCPFCKNRNRKMNFCDTCSTYV